MRNPLRSLGFAAALLLVAAFPAAATTGDFTVSCAPSSLTVPKGGNANATCTVSSTGGFASPVALTCGIMPAGTWCSFSPGVVTPPANGAATSNLQVSAAGSANAGTYNFEVRALGGGKVRTFAMSLTVTGGGGGGGADFSVSCAPNALTVPAGDKVSTTCTVSSINGFSSSTFLSCKNQPAGVACSFSPSSVTPPANGAASSTLKITTSSLLDPGTYTFDVQGQSGTLKRTTSITLTVT